MSKQKRGIFRRLIDVARASVGMSVTRHYDDPVYAGGVAKKSRAFAHGKARVRRAHPCVPGTITYHDKLVRHFGHQRAEGYAQCIQRGFMGNLPSKQDFINNPPWEFLIST